MKLPRKCLDFISPATGEKFGLLATIMHLVFGVTPRQCLRPIAEEANRLTHSPARRAVVVRALAALGVVAGLTLTVRRISR